MRFRFFVFLVAFVACVPAGAAERPPAAAIASAQPQATAAGREILAAGGNAFDAAVAVAAALAVVEPYSSGLGGGGFFLLHRAADDRDIMIDARERAPLAARADMYLDANGDPIRRLSLDGPLAAAIPGAPAGLVYLARHHGKLPLARSLAAAIRLAREGFAVSPLYRRLARYRLDALRKWGTGSPFLDGDEIPALGYVIRQPDLARTLERLAHDGGEDFYRGETARRLADGVRAAGGIWTAADLAKYRVVEREPLRGTYRGAKIVTAALPSSGGVVLLQALGMLERHDLDRLAAPERAHVVIEAMRRAYRDRAVFMGDPDFVPADTVTKLLDPTHLNKMGGGIDLDHATPSAALAPSWLSPKSEGTNTTHFSILDAAGNRVAATLSINTLFGAAFIPHGTGVLLNNEMDDFAVAPGAPNRYGLVGADANAIAPGKRPLSSMTPTFVETKDTIAILGTPGGSRIISMVLLATLDAVDGRGRVADWVARPRFHHQFLPDRVQYEPLAFSEGVAAALARKGHALYEVKLGYGNMQAVTWDRLRRRVEAASDPRGEGEALVLPGATKRRGK